MLFNSSQFIIFFPLAVISYFLTPHKYRWIVLLIASYYFYMSWKAEYIVLIMASTLIDYLSAMQIYKHSSKRKKKLFLSFSLIGNLGMLFTFKYLNFFSESIRNTLNLFSIQFDPIAVALILPVGISFYTFQTLSYTIDVYKGKIKPEKHLGIFAVYVSFFPQLVAGPIERAKNLLPQFFEKHCFEYQRFKDGLKLMLWGFFKKIVIADRLAVVVDTIYNDPTSFTGIPLIIATVFFAFQIYCDFSGYSDIAIGAAKILGFNLMDNFKRPYYSRSISEFWKRWHISLSSWFRDYVYIPLGGSRVPIPKWYANLLIVFLVSGLWHGANWTFVVWGGLHGLYLILEIVLNPLKKRILELSNLVKFPKIVHSLELLFTFALVNVGWIFFRANNVSEGFYILTHLFKGLTLNISNLSIGAGWNELFIALGVIIVMEIMHTIQEHGSIRHFLRNRPTMMRWGIYTTIVVIILLFGMFDNGAEFIYFQF